MKQSNPGNQYLTIQDLLRNRRQPFSQKQQILVSFLFRNYQKVAFMNLNELARETKVSQATIIRLASLLGFKGYPEFQKAVQRLVSQDLTTVERLHLSLDTHEFDHPQEHTLKMDMKNLVRLYQTVTIADVEQIADRILAARRIVVAGFQASGPLALYLGYALQRLLRHVTTFTDEGITLRRSVFDLGRQDLFIGFAFPRYPETIFKVLQAAAENGVRRLVFTDNSAAPIVRLADHPVYLPFEMLSFVDSLAAPLSILAAIVAEIVRRRPARMAENLTSFENMASHFGLFHHE